MLVFVAVLVVFNVLATVLNLGFRINIVGSIVASILVSAIMAWLDRR